MRELLHATNNHSQEGVPADKVWVTLLFLLARCTKSAAAQCPQRTRACWKKPVRAPRVVKTTKAHHQSIAQSLGRLVAARRKKKKKRLPIPDCGSSTARHLEATSLPLPWSPSPRGPIASTSSHRTLHGEAPGATPVPSPWRPPPVGPSTTGGTPVLAMQLRSLQASAYRAVRASTG